MFKKVDNQDMIQQKLSDGSIKRYVKGRLLGKGGFAKCYEVISLQTEKKYAAKIIEKASLQKSKAKEKLSSQIKIHKSMDHPYIVHFEHYFEDAEFVYIMLEKCSNQTLNQLLKRRKRLTDIETKYYIRQLAIAIKYMHEQQIIHRDLKLGNLFLSQKLDVKIGDFGLATKLQYVGQRKKTKCGTPNYIAPQILDDKKSHSYEVDIWSMGVITYALLVGRPPFQTNDVKDTYNKIRECNYSFPTSANVSESAQCFISKMLQLDPSKRATIDELLQDPFLSQYSVPSCLPISSLACPPSYDFLKKYRDLQTEESKPSIKDQSEHTEPVKERKLTASNAPSQQKKQYKFSSRVNSVQKTLKTGGKVLSAANLQSNPKSSVKPKKIKTQLAQKALKVFVTYFEQNTKYGLGYILNSNATGFRFNDFSAMIANVAQTRIKYIEYDHPTRKLKEAQSVIYKPEQVQEKNKVKYKILSHFQRQLAKLKNQTQKEMPIELRSKLDEMKFKETAESALKCYVTRYHRSQKGIIFWLSMGAVQMIYEDGSQIHGNKNGIMAYVNKNKDVVYFQEKNRQSQPQNIKKRLLHFYSVVKTNVMRKPAQLQNNNSQSRPEKKGQKVQHTMNRCNSSKPGYLMVSNRQLKTSSSNANLKNA